MHRVPEVEITDQGVTFGEDENTIRLSHAMERARPTDQDGAARRGLSRQLKTCGTFRMPTRYASSSMIW